MAHERELSYIDQRARKQVGTEALNLAKSVMYEAANGARAGAMQALKRNIVGAGNHHADKLYEMVAGGIQVGSWAGEEPVPEWLLDLALEEVLARYKMLASTERNK